MILPQNKNCWILATARSGSTYLANILNCTGIFPERFDEVFQIKSIPPHPLPVNAKIMPIQFRHHQLTKKDIESQIPNLRYLRLLRKDVFAHAASVYFCKITQIKHLRTEAEVESYFSKPIGWQEDIAIAAWEEVRSANSKWNFFVKEDVVDVFYENLLENPVLELSKTLKLLSIRHKEQVLVKAVSDANKLLIRCSRPESEEYTYRIKELVETKGL